jgi:uncharacterized protein (DUF1501 family)
MTSMPDSVDETIARAAAGCEESRLLMSRRAMLGVTTGLFSWAYAPRWATAMAGEASSDPRFLVVVLRGGMDGLSTVVPFGDNSYYSLRGDIAIPRNRTIKLDNFFGLHPAMRRFGKMYRKGQAAVVHAACVPLRTRSHFDTQDNLENGYPDAVVSNSTGWLNRLLQALPTGSPILSHGAIQIGEAPLILRGSAPVLGWSPASYPHLEDPLLYMVRSLYQQNDAQMHAYLEAGIRADHLAEGKGGKNNNVSELRKGFRGAARLLRAPNGPRIAVLSVDGWDTHADQGSVSGQLAGMLSELDRAIDDFRRQSGPAWSQTVMVLATEFGRTAHENGDSGTDHGVGTVALLAGGAVRGGKVFGDWPGLAPGQLLDGSDLRATTDMRSIFKGVLSDHLGVADTILSDSVFPESGNVSPFQGLVRSPSGDGAEIASADKGRPVQLFTQPPIARFRQGVPVSTGGARTI